MKNAKYGSSLTDDQWKYLQPMLLKTAKRYFGFNSDKRKHYYIVPRQLIKKASSCKMTFCLVHTFSLWRKAFATYRLSNLFLGCTGSSWGRLA
jgi:hypothetical protein